jgi:pyruvate,water dikinase
VQLSNDLSSQVFGKARTLLELESAGFRVPQFLYSPTDLGDAVRQLGTPLAVRSSASVEDGSAFSFAGQFRSFLNLRTVEQVKAAVQACRESIRSPGVIGYCQRHGVDPNALRMGVIVQRMIEPDLAGVAFTVNPSTGAEEVVIEACEGLADELLLGRKPALSPNHSLVRKHAAEIGATARRIQRHFGAPQDIEFAIRGRDLYILQARPITRIEFAPETGQWTNADFRDGGVSSTVCTPLMWSLYDFIWEHTLKGFLCDIKLLDGDFQAGRMFFGRPYWNLGAVKSCLMKLPGFKERDFDKDLSVKPTYEGDGACTPVTLRGVLRALPTIFSIQSIWKKQERFDRQFLAGGFDALTNEYQGVPDTSPRALRRLIEHAYRVTESNYFRTIYCASLAKLDFSDSFPEADYASLVAGLPRLQHFEPAHALRDMRRRGVSDFTSFLDRFKHHSRRELDIRAPRWDEDQGWVRTLFEQCPDQPLFDARPQYEEARQKELGRLSWAQRRRFARKLDRLRRFLWLREEMRDLSSRMYYILRRHVLAVAGRRGLGDDIFFMTFQQVLADDRREIERQRVVYESYRNFKAPNEITGHSVFPTSPQENALCGIAVSHGTARGTARVARCVEEAAQIEQGAILVCPYTDPGWTPILSRVAGVVAETGGLLSHAAIICREYGIPALLGVPDATTRIRDGAAVVLHADLGRLEMVPQPGPNKRNTPESPAPPAPADQTTPISQPASQKQTHP